jgi:hypothetical protein
MLDTSGDTAFTGQEVSVTPDIDHENCGMSAQE